MNKILISFLTAVCCFFLCGAVVGQQKNADTAQLHPVTVNMDEAFNKEIGTQSRLYNGLSYDLNISKDNIGNPYFRDTTVLFNGRVIYDGIVYNNVPLIYDLYNDLLISRLYHSGLLFSFISEDVAGFDLLDHHFIRVQPANSSKLVRTGFYDELYNNKLQLLAKRTKSTQKGTRGFGIPTIAYIPDNDYYLKKDGIYYEVNSRGKFFNVLGDKKKELKKYLKDNMINFKDNPEQTMVVLARYYDNLTK